MKRKKKEDSRGESRKGKMDDRKKKVGKKERNGEGEKIRWRERYKKEREKVERSLSERRKEY